MLEGDGGPQLPVQAELLPRTGMFGWVFPGPRGGSLGNNPVTWNVGAFNLEKKKKPKTRIHSMLQRDVRTGLP